MFCAGFIKIICVYIVDIMCIRKIRILKKVQKCTQFVSYNEPFYTSDCHSVPFFSTLDYSFKVILILASVESSCFHAPNEQAGKTSEDRQVTTAGTSGIAGYDYKEP